MFFVLIKDDDDVQCIYSLSGVYYRPSMINLMLSKQNYPGKITLPLILVLKCNISPNNSSPVDIHL